MRLGSDPGDAEGLAAFPRWRQRSAAQSSCRRGRGIAARRRRNPPCRRCAGTAAVSEPHATVGSRGEPCSPAPLLIVAAVAIALPSLSPLSALYADHATGVGGRKRVALADGTVVILNTATAVSVDYSGKERRVVLHDGEALFEVAKDANRPFIVVAGDVEVRAVGTAFVVRLKDACEHVTVSEGTVEVKIGSRPAIKVEAGQRLGVGEGDRFKLRTVDIDAATAWQRGKLIFNRRPLDSVVTELQRYRAGRIVVLGERLKALEVTGVFDLDDTDRILRTIEETTKARIVNMPLLTVIR